jgi:hypothetical protein
LVVSDLWIFRCLADELSMWISKDQPRISLSSILVSKLRGKYLL